MTDHWLADVTDVAVRRAVGEQTYERGLDYLLDERVLSVSAAANRSVTGVVEGHNGHTYSTVVAVQPATPGAHLRIAGRCSCPMSVNCKHVAAVLLAARDRLGGRPHLVAVPSPPSWEQVLAAVIEQSGPEEVAETVPLALQFEITLGSGRYGPPSRLTMRPMVRGKKGRWIKTGASWRELESPYARHSLRPHPAHRETLLRLLRESRPEPTYYGYQDRPVHLDDIGRQAWPLLADLLDAGVEFIDPSGRPVEVSDSALEVRLDVSTADGPAVLSPVLEAGGVEIAPAGLTFLGDPAHGAYRLTSSGGLQLLPLARPLPDAVVQLLRSGPIAIPEHDVDRFRRGWYRQLSAVVPVSSADHSVHLPQIDPPTLILEVRFLPGHQADLAWSFGYRVDDEVLRVPVGSPLDPEHVRDRTAETLLLQGFSPPSTVSALLVNGGELIAARRLGGLDTAALVDALPALVEGGVAVESHGSPAEYRYSRSSPVIASTVADSDSRDWFDLQVSMSIDGEDVPFAPLFSAVVRGEPQLLLDSGTYFDIDRPELDQLRRLIEEARALQDQPPGGLRISPFQAGLWEELASIGVVDAQSRRWSRSVDGLLSLQSVPAPEPPAGLDAVLRPYQLAGFQWLDFLWEHEIGGVLADDMGLGKTLQMLAAICRAKEQGRLDQPALVVAPTSVVANWAVEAARFAPGLRIATVNETQARRDTSLAERVAGADLVVTSYALLRLDFDAYQKISWSMLALDEAQAVKNHQARGYQCARRLTAPVKFVITGTPLENNLMELWALLSIAAPGMFPHPQRFAEHFRRPIERGDDPALLTALRRRIRPLMLRRTKDQVAADLPPKQEQLLEVPLSPRHRKIYDTHLARERQKVLGLLNDMQRNRFEILRSLTLLRRLALDPALIDGAYETVGSAKVDVLVEQLRELAAEGHRALVFSQFTGFLGIVRRRLDAEGIGYGYLDGRTRSRAAAVAEFKDGTAPVFLISIKAGGFGLNLTEADYVFVLDPWWNPAVEAQAVDRTHRIGQNKTVMVYRMVATETIEEKVMELQSRKRDLFARVVDEDGLLAAPLSVDDIRGLLG